MQNRLRNRVGVSIAAGCLALGLLAAPANAAPPQVDYVALGDSFSYGVGNNGSSYADTLDARKYIDLDKAALPSGGTVAGVSATLGSVTPDAGLITLTVGGNDLNWVGILQACASSQLACQAALAAAYGQLPALGAGLTDLFGAIKTLAPDAKVVVLGYPHLFTPDPADPMTPLYLQINAATDQLNAVIRAAATGAGFEFVDVTQRFAEHGANAPNPWINPYPAVNPAAIPLHPNAKGQQAYYAAVRTTGNLT